MPNVKSCLATLLPLLGLLTFLTSCSTGKDLDATAAASIKRIAVIEPYSPDQYLVGSNRDPNSIAGSASLFGDIIKSNNADNDVNRQFRAGLAKENLTLGADIASAIQAALQQDGYEVVSASLSAQQPAQLHTDLSSLKDKADAALDIAILDAGYAYWTGHPYEPSVDVAVQLTDLRSQTVIFRRTYSYSRYSPEQGIITDEMIPPASGFEFKNGRLLSQDPSRAAAGLRSSIEPIATRVGTTLKLQK
jgi:hypothetical protein